MDELAGIPAERLMMGKIFAVALRLQEPEITARCYGKDCGRGILASLFDDDIGALVPCAQDACPFLEKQTDEPLWKDGEGRDVYLRRLVPLADSFWPGDGPGAAMSDMAVI